MDGRGGGERAAARVRGVLARGAGRAVRAAAAHARRARPAPGAAQQGQHARLRALPRRPAGHVGGARRQYRSLYLLHSHTRSVPCPRDGHKSKVKDI